MEEVGAIAGLGAAMCWALASVLYTRVPIGAGAMTTFKNVFAASFLFVALVIESVVRGKPLFDGNAAAYWDISLSGVIGLCLADIAYFRSIQILGPRQGLTLTLLIPPATAILGQMWLNDTLSAQLWLFVGLTIAGIGLVMRERPEATADQQIRPGSVSWGVTCALLGVVTMAVGAVILKRGSQSLGAIEGTFMRLLAASVFGIVLSFFLGELREIRTLMRDRKGTAYLCAAAWVGTVIGVFLMLLSYKYCPTGIAATLTSTTPLFIIPVAYFVYRQTISGLAIIGAVGAFLGVCGLLLWPSP